MYIHLVLPLSELMYLVFTQSQTGKMSLRQLAPTYAVHNLHATVKLPLLPGM